MIRFAWLLALLAGFWLAAPSYAASVTATTGWVCINSDEPGGSYTIDAGSNRKFVVAHMEERNVDPAATFTVGGQAPTETLSFSTTTPTSTDHYHRLYIWDAAAITAMSGTAISYTDANTAVSKAFCAGTIENANQTALSAYADTDVALNAGSLTLTTTSNVGDLVLVQSVAENTGATHTWSAGINEVHDADGADSWRGGFATGNADSVTVTYAVSTEDVSAAAAVFADAPAAPTFSAGPTESTNTTTTVLFTFTPSASATVHWQLRNSGTSAAADCAAVQTHTGALDFGSKAITGADSDTVDFVHYEGDADFCLVNGNGSSAVSTVNDVVRTCVGSCVELTSLSATSYFAIPLDTAGDTDHDGPGDPYEITGMADTSDFAVDSLVTASAGFADTVLKVTSKTASSIFVDQPATSSQTNITVTGLVDAAGATLISPTPAAGHWLEYVNTADIGGAVAFDAGWDSDWTPQMGESELLARIRVCPQDTSDTTPEYAAPFNCRTGGGGFASFYENNVAPTFDIDSIQNIALTVGGAQTSLQIGAMCTHAFGLSTTVSLRGSDALPSGSAYDSVNQEIDITNLVEDENGFQVRFWCNSDTKYSLQTWTAYPVNTWARTDCVGLTVDECETATHVDAPWLNPVTLIETTDCSPTVPRYDIISQSPAAAAQIAAYASLGVEVSTGLCGAGRAGGGQRLRMDERL